MLNVMMILFIFLLLKWTLHCTVNVLDMDSWLQVHLLTHTKQNVRDKETHNLNEAGLKTTTLMEGLLDFATDNHTALTEQE